MTRRDISLKKRGTKTKKERVTYLVVTEGRNKTETLYLSHFQVQGKDYYLRFVKAGNNTDAESLYKTLTTKWKEMGLSYASGDRGFVVLDIDNDPQKAEKVLSIIHANRNEAISFIVSNPAFEVWFLLHFKYTTKFYVDGYAVIKDLKKFIPNYEKNFDCYDLCNNSLSFALKNIERLKGEFENVGWPSVECNPMTDMAELVRMLTE